MKFAAAATEVRPMARLFKALGDETRLRIVALLSHGELCVCHIEAALGLPQPTASRHLGILRAAGVVDTRRQGTWMYYRLAEPDNEDCRGQLDSLVRAFGRRDVLRADVARLVETRGPLSCK